MSRSNRRLVLAVFLSCAAAPVSAQNLLQNGTFDTDVAPWVGFNSPATFSPLDAAGSPTSGSLRIAHSGASSVDSVRSECVPIAGGAAFSLRFDYRLEATAGIDASVQAIFAWFADPACGLFLSSNGGFSGPEEDGAWHSSPFPDFEFSAPLAARGVRLSLVVGKSGPGTATAHFDNVALKPAHACAALPHVLCLNRERFQVEASWRTATDAGRAAVVKLTDDTGYLWFFGPANVEVVIKVLDACGPFGKYWVFAGGLTDVEVEITVTDTQTGEQKTYDNVLGVPFAPVQDTDAFDTCP